MSEPNRRLFKVLRAYCKVAAASAAAVGCLVLYGWAFHLELLTSPLPGLVAMKVNTAVGLAFSGISLWLLLPGESRRHSRHIAHFLALLVALIGAASLSEYLFGLNLRIDELLMNDPMGSFGTSSPGRMAPTTAMALLALGLALILLDLKTRRCQVLAQILSLWAGLISMLAVTGYLYHAIALYRILLYTQMAVHTAITLLLLSGAVFFARPTAGIAGDLTSEASGSTMARRFLPAVFFIPLFLGWISLRGQFAGWYGTELGLAFYATSSIVVFALLVWLNARIMNVEYGQRSAAEKGIRKLNAELEGRVAERTKALEEQAAILTEQAALLDLAQDAIVVWDMHNRILSWNRGAEALYGWFRKETVGRNKDELLGTEFSESTQMIEVELLRQGHWEGEAIQHKHDGTRLIVASRWTLQRDADGAPARILTINNDITDHKEAESNLRSLTERLSLATSVAKVGVWEWDLASNMLTWDATMLDIYRFPPAASMSYEKWSAAVCPEDLPAVEAILQRAIDEKGQGSAEFRIVRADGSVRNIFAIEKVALDAHGAVRRVIGVNVDVTERKESEAAMRAAKEAAEAANRSKSEFLANMSHEIRTPMNGIIGMTELALDTELTPEQRRYLGTVKSSADALLTLMNDILDFSKIEAGKFELDPIEFNLRDSIDDTTRSMALRADGKGLELALEVSPETPDFLVGDPARLRQILVNLLGNSIKFTQKGEVVLHVETEDEAGDGVMLHFSVRDTGIGIPKDRQAIIFEAFTQADNSTTRKFGGTGLGLTITTRLVKLMGGRIWEESEPDKGSTFHFTARFGLGEAPATLAPAPESVDLRGLRVLVVDDNSTNRRILQEILISWQMLPTLVEGGQEALAALQEAQESGNTFPLVLTDMQMPQMDGFALAQHIKENPLEARATVMMLTSAGQRGDGARCRELGIAAFLTKPVQQSELREAILAALGNRPQQATGATLVTRHSLREAHHRFRILLAEDNPVNQTVAVTLLEKRGHTVVLAHNGREALEILEESPSGAFDIVLMDVQMPEMDGFEATAAIREREKRTGRRLPIVAMTAHALKGYEERCAVAGMDGYISKPIRSEELFRVIENHARRFNLGLDQAPVQQAPAETLDAAALLDHVEGDVGLLRELVEIFWGHCPKMLSDIHRALVAESPKALMRAAHALKGSLTYFGTSSALQAARKLETLGEEGRMEGAAELFSELQQGLSDIKPALAALGKESGA